MSGSHIMILAVILVILVLGPAKLPGLGKSMGEAIRGFKKGIAGEDDNEIDVTHSSQEKLDSSTTADMQRQKNSEKNKA